MDHHFDGNCYHRWRFSIAILVYRRVILDNDDDKENDIVTMILFYYVSSYRESERVRKFFQLIYKGLVAYIAKLVVWGKISRLRAFSRVTAFIDGTIPSVDCKSVRSFSRKDRCLTGATYHCWSQAQHFDVQNLGRRDRFQELLCFGHEKNSYPSWN